MNTRRGSSNSPYRQPATAHANAVAIRHEIQRFESVHPSIYALYDMIDAIHNPLLQQQMREHVICIEDSFVNSQEWTLGRSVPDLRLGVLGTSNSGKSALVHRYLTGSYLHEESSEGGRFKKEVIVDGQSFLLLIRDEGGPPDMQFSHWVDAVILTFSLESEVSFNTVYTYHSQMVQYRAGLREVPLILVGTQDMISEANPRLIEDARSRLLAAELKCCAYFETCATYGLNVERVFHDACLRIVRAASSFPGVLSGSGQQPVARLLSSSSCKAGSQLNKPGSAQSPVSSQAITGRCNGVTNSFRNIKAQSPPFRDQTPSSTSDMAASVDNSDRSKSVLQRLHSTGNNVVAVAPQQNPHNSLSSSATEAVSYVSVPLQQQVDQENEQPVECSSPLITPSPLHKLGSFKNAPKSGNFSEQSGDSSRDFSSPSTTPTPVRKNRRKSNLFSKKDSEDKKLKNGDAKVGSGRIIPLKQGYLFKRSSKALSKDWQKKYVTLLDDGRLTYHSSLHDYMEDNHGKEIKLVRTTVKVPGQRPRGSESTSSANQTAGNQRANGHANKLLDSSFDAASDQAMTEAVIISNASVTSGTQPDQNGSNLSCSVPSSVTSLVRADVPNVKKKHRRIKSTSRGSDPCADSDGNLFEFVIVSLDNKQWQFTAQSAEERDEWVAAVEKQILSSLQLLESNKSKDRVSTLANTTVLQTVRSVPGNEVCADCSASSPDWASLNFGALVCIECSGVHRNLSGRLSRVRSLELDEWPSELVKVMASAGNDMVNSIWEANVDGHKKPSPTSTRDEKDQWIRSKYEQCDFLAHTPYTEVAIHRQLFDAVARRDIRGTLLVLAHSTSSGVNLPYSDSDLRTPLHIAAAIGDVVLVQLLVWSGADVKLRDHEGFSAAYYAQMSGSIDCVQLLHSLCSPPPHTVAASLS